jgi:hypothetical protein
VFGSFFAAGYYRQSEKSTRAAQMQDYWQAATAADLLEYGPQKLPRDPVLSANACARARAASRDPCPMAQ